MFIKKFDYERVPELQRMCMDWAPCKRLREKEIFDRCEVPTRDPPEQKNKIVSIEIFLSSSSSFAKNANFLSSTYSG